MPYVTLAGHFLLWFMSDLVIWWYWWKNPLGLQLLYHVGRVAFPVYSRFLRFADVNFICHGGKFKCHVNSILPVDCRLLILSEVFNVHSHFLYYLRRNILSYNGSYANLVIKCWKNHRREMDEYPPHGWPLHTWLTLFIYFIYTKLIIIGYL